MKKWLSPTRILVLGFLIVIMIGAILLRLPMSHEPGINVSFVDALFTATSAVCVTGLVVVDTATTYSTTGEIIILALIQIGGLGFVTFATLFTILLGRRVSMRERLLLSEAYNQPSMQGIVHLLLMVLYTTLIFEFLGFLLYAIRFVADWGWAKGLYYAMFHSISAFNNAGFDLFGDIGKFSSFTHYVNDPLVNLTATGLIIFGGLGFLVLMELYNYRQTKRLSLHTKLVLLVTGLLIIVGTFVILAIEWTNPKTLGQLPWYGKILASYFQAVSPRTAGINTINLADMYPASLFFTIILMFIGASPGSTGGGIKTTTFIAIILAAWSLTRGHEDVVIFKRRIAYKQVYKALTVVVMAIVLVMVVTMLITILEHTDILTAMYETTSAFGTVGLTMGLTPTLSTPGKILIMITMFAGRLGPLTVGLALARRGQPPSYKYPEEKPIIG
ncbi:trk system potassium uptake protein TrkH [Seinonella peptonophila]|uniref:Trk system potassium uptake protein TrkH n=1 Tax=Seinonella peptonophila TaxID=112248 RepID=A0A1M4VRW8_9BACL|nr:trk system potassium uptake protein TrkH [Seinonella peptonophila]